MGTWYSKPWRKVEWEESTRNSLKTSVQNYTPIIKSVPRARILLVGDVGAGKSSFFNSISSVFCGSITSQANAGPNLTSQTLKFRTYNVREGKGGRPLSFLLCDTMGLEQTANGGVNTDDIESILKGYIPDGYQFDPKIPWNQNGDQAHTPPLKERIHCVVFVVDASTLPLKYSKDDRPKKFIKIKERANLLEVPLMVLLTKVDRVCPHTGKDLKNVYWSNYLKEQIYKASDFLGIQVSSVFPVKNYCSETELDMRSDILLLAAMQKMLHLADDFFANFVEDGE
ncbi:interferon-induced protein 44-like isoform X3 [Brienomyrus brachyistius]|uniref:interferon-induced protein 44-like isoform X3 n=1 Tax=Brienomyrus brachyistius TaxID=42636 RepID=UPI0020B38F09|nr:interferon-induced protein 44-like isoform X3 [Brienomyrus brachyistius]XP_048851275.1 interferon-induced protein 44-like isoform X3 [Brienomyrus brachyistius]